jgi:hypothetical protein
MAKQQKFTGNGLRDAIKSSAPASAILAVSLVNDRYERHHSKSITVPYER